MTRRLQPLPSQVGCLYVSSTPPIRGVTRDGKPTNNYYVWVTCGRLNYRFKITKHGLLAKAKRIEEGKDRDAGHCEHCRKEVHRNRPIKSLEVLNATPTPL